MVTAVLLENQENALREELNKTSPRVFAVVDPIKVIITNYPKDKTEMIEAVNNPEKPDSGVRKILFSRELFIERNDFMEDPPKKVFPFIYWERSKA